ncbi:citrate (pro-3S)-lyase subunit beta [Fusibacter ferrireducens]|uniref:Citrate lyase subunit beta n=1 Tax=Fusibacter ferrireducens TaxID=2785058 RepID=A0ABR9ZXW6_9FIRM|nr:citrate (pro-3S)-lyase subunit beta [Fusibacter ferrireducens]MBF4695294.1 citrate (pro-3S)-lyase subunit beta [Fusibacter ferrireducens]
MSRLRRTMLYVPGSNPGMLADAVIYGADSIMFDLEDAISLREKDSARLLVYRALQTVDFGSTELVCRINGLDTPFGEKDIEAVVAGGIHVVRLPKTETAEDIQQVEALIEKAEVKYGREVGSIKMMAAIESALGIMNAYEIAHASQRLIGIALGAEDYVTNLKTKRSPGGIELLYARSQLLNAARSAGIAALDTVYSDIDNMTGFAEEVELIKQLGFDGKSVINPRQIPVVHQLFKPTDKEIAHAKDVVKAIEEAEAKGLGVISLRGKMIDKPIVERALRILDLSEASE